MTVHRILLAADEQYKPQMYWLKNRYLAGRRFRFRTRQSRNRGLVVRHGCGGNGQELLPNRALLGNQFGVWGR